MPLWENSWSHWRKWERQKWTMTSWDVWILSNHMLWTHQWPTRSNLKCYVLNFKIPPQTPNLMQYKTRFSSETVNLYCRYNKCKAIFWIHNRIGVDVSHWLSRRIWAYPGRIWVYPWRFSWKLKPQPKEFYVFWALPLRKSSIFITYLWRIPRFVNRGIGV